MSANVTQSITRKSARSRMIALLIAGALVIGTTVVWRHFRYARPIGEGPAGPAVSPAKSLCQLCEEAEDGVLRRRTRGGPAGPHPSQTSLGRTG